MNYNEFMKEISKEVQFKLGADYKVKVQKVDKINTEGLQSMVIWDKKQKMTPNIYLETFYDEFLEGRAMDDIVNEIIVIYNNADTNPISIIDCINDFETIKSKIYFRVVNYKKNEINLQYIPSIPILDLALVFCILVKQDENGIGNITITNDIINKWNISITEVYKEAQINTPHLFPPTVKSMSEVMMSIMKKEISQNDIDMETMEMMNLFVEDLNNQRNEETMYVASNTIGINGAAWLFYENELKEFRNKIGANLYILPSSIHEVILVPSNERLSKEDLLKMVKDVNSSQVPENEILSNNIYEYKNDIEGIIALF
ncbi:hypothetical protein EDD66_10484 [Mobilisporobacter senegalensis]|uniref:DUF1444 family protein n=1 Tax=Mobilisporobacter senegalensis TaxID=1329262 RepID=A0A3N1XTL3_9FIRM|nr:DUF5688 family protein [Mobilisporobacter senegalensis]ROR28502.1 hypothetical protein EDD66_10484 [Mobilisporobacter senegalensis]